MIFKKISLAFFFIVINISILQSQPLSRVRTDTTKWKAPFFELKDINGNKIKQSDLIGKVVVLNFWGTHCLPCINELPQLNTVVKEFKSKKVEFIALCPLVQSSFSMDKYQELKSFLKTHEFLYKVSAPDDFSLLARKFAAQTLPTHFIIDKRGFIVYKYAGSISEKELTKRITNELNK